MAAATKKATTSGATRLSYLDAIVQAHIEEMDRDARVIMMGEDIAVYGGGRVIDRFGESRVWSMPISETSFTGAAIGAAITGLRPIVDLNIASFMYLASDPIINQAAKLRYMTGGQVSIPVVFRCCMYYGTSLAAQHSDRPYPFFLNTPGLKIISPTSPTDMKGMLKAAIRDDGPVLVFEDTKLWPGKEEVPTDPDFIVPLGQAGIKREGADLTVVAISGAMRVATSAVDDLAREGVSAELIDPRTLKPLDTVTIARSVRKTGRLLLVENAHRTANLSAEIAAEIAEVAFQHLRAPITRLCTPDIHPPFSPALEEGLYPSKDQIISAARRLIGAAAAGPQ